MKHSPSTACQRAASGSKSKLPPQSLKDYVTPERTEYHAGLLANRLKNRYRHLARKFKRAGIDVFRLYDRDIPEIRAVVDWYKGHLVVAEYIRQQTGPQWLPRMARAAGEALGVPQEKVFIKRRRTGRVRSGRKDQRRICPRRRIEVNEGDLKFWVQLDGDLDTGLFSDHRITRALVRGMVKGADVLNLFGYTGTFSCAAAKGGARSVVTVDRSAMYLNWAKENLKLNGLEGKGYIFVRSDVQDYLATIGRGRKKFTFAVVDPPSFSARRGPGTFDINKHHTELLTKVFAVMAPGSAVLFSTNHQRFDPKFSRLKVKKVEEWTDKTVPEDYRNKRVHRCWKIDLP